jgi:hypothetical protein
MELATYLIGGGLLVIFYIWWIVLPVIVIPIMLSALTFWKQQAYKQKSMESTLLELRIPTDLQRTPRAMEQVLIAIHGLRNAPRSWKDYHLEGQVTRWFSFEIVSQGGTLRFFVRTPASLKNLVEASLFSYYPEVEIAVVPDYAAELPSTVFDMQEKGLDLWGTEITSAKDPVIPFKTYQAFSSGEKDGIDPLSSLVEILGKLKPDQFAGVQVIASPADRGWSKAGGAVIAKIKESGALTPGETISVKEIEDNVSKPAFDVLIRTMYIAPKEGFSNAFVASGVTNALNQLSSPKHNGFSATLKTGGKGNKDRDTKARMLWMYRTRGIPQNEFFGKWATSTRAYKNNQEKWAPMSVETLATIFHPLTSSVLTAPHLERLSSRRVSAPAGLEIYGDDDAIKRFL